MIKNRPIPSPPKTATVSISADTGDDNDWDSFLENHPAGRHEQTSRWARIKALSGWGRVRVMLTAEDAIIGGFQLLHRSGRFHRIGYISHGPVMDPDHAWCEQELLDQIWSIAREHRLTAILLQAPFGHHSVTDQFLNVGALPNRLQGIIETTAQLDLTLSHDDLLARMRRDRRRNIRKSLTHAFEFRQGTRDELGTFFALMTETCRRQSTSPNPPDLKTIHALWDLYAPRNWMRLFFVVLNGETVSTALTIPFGDRLWFWKIGWSGAHKKLFPNDFLHWKTICWAKEKGYRNFDFLGIDKRAGKETDSGESVPEHSPSFYKLGFGPEIVNLEPSLIYFQSKILRAAYRTFIRFRRG